MRHTPHNKQMSFATATIQGYITWIGNLQQTPSGRNVVNLLVSVPYKKKEGATTYKVSIWDGQAGSVLKWLKPRQLITAQGQLSVEEYKGKNENTMLRLDFASILDYGVPISEEGKPSFIKIDLENVGEKTAVLKKTAVKV